MPQETPTPPAAKQAENTNPQPKEATQGSAASSNNKQEQSSSTVASSSKEVSGNVAKLKEMRTNILGLPYKYGKTSNSTNPAAATSTTEVVDIIHDYPWIAESVKETANSKDILFRSINTGSAKDADPEGYTYSKKTNVPVCYIAERKSVVNAGIANIIGLLSSVNDIGNSAAELSASAGDGIIGTASGAISEGISSFKRMVSENIEKYLPGFAALLKANNLNDEILNPYRYLYITADTGKRYVFPLASSESAGFIQGKLAWGAPKGGTPGWMKKINDALSNVLNNVIAGATLVRNFSSLGGDGSTSDDNGNVNEKIKSFTYPETGETIKVSFTLYNTTKKNAWKDNFRFLYLWAVRNLPLRTETISFIPPMLYDIIIPGIKRMPVCALTQMAVKPTGMTRLLECPNFIDTKSTGRTIPVNVPEAWIIDLTFQSLIGPSANLMLANTVGQMGIEAAMDFGEMTKLNAEELASTASEMDEKREEIRKLCEDIKRSEEFDKAREQMKQAEINGYANQMYNFADHNLLYGKKEQISNANIYDAETKSFKKRCLCYNSQIRSVFSELF